MSARLVFFSQINPFCLSLSCYVPFYKVRALSRAARRSRGRIGEGCIESRDKPAKNEEKAKSSAQTSANPPPTTKLNVMAPSLH